MRADEFAARLQQLAETPKRHQADLVLAIEEGLRELSAAELESLISTCENAMLQPAKTARTSPAMKLLLRACATRLDLSADRLLRAGITLPTLLEIAQRTRLSDLPPGPALAEELVARLFSLAPAGDGADASPLLGGRPLLQAVQQLELSQALLPEATAEALLRHAVQVEPGRLSRRQLSELGAAAPAWRPLILRALLQPPGPGRRYAAGLRDLVRLAQDWGLHSDPEVFEGLRQAIEAARASRSEADLDGENEEEEAAPPHLESGMQVMQCSPEERIVLVDGRPEAEAELVATREAAARALASGGTVTVALDAEWEDPRPLSLLQIAVAVGEEPATAFLVDMLVPLSEAACRSCQELLRGSSAAWPEEERKRQRVLCFSASEDARRLAVAGLLPELLPGLSDREPADSGKRSGPADVLGWTDLQREPWGLGLQPSLQAVVKQELGLCLDKKHQRSNWDARPLSAEQIEYAALDASVLVRLYRYALARRSAKPERSSGGEGASPPASPATLLTREEERAKWRRRRALAQEAAAGVDGSATVGVGKDGDRGRDANDGLRFLVPAALSKLMRKMRGLGLDTAIMEEGAPPQEFAQVALKEERIILIRSRKMNVPARAADLVYVVRSNAHDEQLREIIDVFDVEIDEDCLCGRCGECNTWDWRLATREEMRGNPQVSEKTLQAFDQYWVCGGCGKAFWEGRIHEKAMSHFRSFKPPEKECGDGA